MNEAVSLALCTTCMMLGVGAGALLAGAVIGIIMLWQGRNK